MINTFYLEGQGATQGKFGVPDDVGVSQSLNVAQITNVENVAYSATQNMLLYVALNTGAGEELWQINTGDAKIVPLNYPILKTWATKP